MQFTHVKIAPSILSADFARLGEECRAVEQAGSDWIHIDVMDGHFVPNLTIGPDVCTALRSAVSKHMDVHLMVSPVETLLDSFLECGADSITVHLEAGPQMHRACQRIKKRGIRTGIAINPGSPAIMVREYLDLVDLICVMTVNPGYGGQAFIEEQLPKIAEISRMIGERDVLLQVDGGVSTDNTSRLVEHGADVLVAGTSVFRGGSPENPAPYMKNIGKIRKAASAGWQLRSTSQSGKELHV